MSKDKTILVVKIPATEDRLEFEEMCNNAKEAIKSEYGPDDVPVIITMSWGSDYFDLQCLNPVVLNEEQYAEYDKIIKDLKQVISEWEG
jgi:hypothetical protein